jgi:Icc-related predicted phosphoesterase
VKIVAISDTHGMYDKIQVPEGDVLIHAGDITMHGYLHELNAFNAWVGTLSHAHKLVIAGNHDWEFQRRPLFAQEAMTNCTYLQDSAVVIDGVTFYGAPWQPTFYNWAFNVDRGAPIREKSDVLITHGPAFGHLDMTPQGLPVGCEELAVAIERIKPKAHIFGHIHHAYGIKQVAETIYVNASVCNEQYKPVNAPWVFEI